MQGNEGTDSKSIEAEFASVVGHMRMYLRMVSSTSDPLAFVNRDYIYHVANESYCQAHGKKRNEIIGHTIAEVFGTEDFHRKIKQHLDRSFTGKKTRYQEWFHLAGWGLRYLDVTYNPHIGSDGIVLGIVVNSRDITELKQNEEIRVKQASQAAREEELKRSRQRIINVEESIRKEIAQQLHGTVQNRLIVIIHQLAQLEQEISQDKITTELREIRQKLSALTEHNIRAMSHRLYPAILRQGLIAALPSLGDQFESESNIDVNIELDPYLVESEKANRRLIPESSRLAIYRITEEALTNVLKHAKASNVTISLELLPDQCLHLIVSDDGQGFDKQRNHSGLGMAIMQDYADVSSGRCTVSSVPCEGTKVEATLSFAEPGEDSGEKRSPLE